MWGRRRNEGEEEEEGIHQANPKAIEALPAAGHADDWAPHIRLGGGEPVSRQTDKSCFETELVRLFDNSGRLIESL